MNPIKGIFNGMRIHDLNEDGFVSDSKENFINYPKDVLALTFEVACKAGQLDVVQYILTSPQLQELLEDKNIETGFIQAFENEKIPVLQYLIFDLNIEPTMKIYESMKGYAVSGLLFKMDTSTHVNQIQNMFKIRDLNLKLQEELSSNKPNKQKNKI
jgi:hypothetical protein